ncbi:hypothetical protein BDN67DRAFT_501895 [Paxillus ammoniavirescens]|nr:hypothetical protein BDN67DRAFT_501895 [Paxillus ammoniavirescens]
MRCSTLFNPRCSQPGRQEPDDPTEADFVDGICRISIMIFAVGATLVLTHSVSELVQRCMSTNGFPFDTYDTYAYYT